MNVKKLVADKLSLIEIKDCALSPEEKNISYIIKMPDNNIIVITNEKELHFKTVNFIRKYYPSVIIIPGLGENQKNIIFKIY